MHLRRSVTSRFLTGLFRRPGVALRLLGDPPDVWVDGRRLNRGLQLLLAAQERLGMRGPVTDWERARSEMRRLVKLSSPVPDAVSAVDRRVPGPGGDIPVRVYRPHGTPGPLPVMVFLHGGGFAVGDLDTHDPTCRLLAVGARCVVVSVDYRLAPEHRFPAAVDDSVAAYEWVLDNPAEVGGVPGVVGVMGDSAGGNLAAAVCLEARRLGLAQPAVQCLIYPLTDARLVTESYQTFAVGFGLDLEGVELYRDTYARSDADWVDPRMSPQLADDFSGLAPALIVTAGFDVLRDDGRAYADALAAAGVPVTYRCVDDMIHGFHAMLFLPEAEAVAREVADAVGVMLLEGIVED